VTQYSLDLIKPINPAQTLSGQLTRNFNSTCGGSVPCVAGDFIPQGDPTNPQANGNLGVSPNPTWGQVAAVPTLQFDESWSKGFLQRPYNWEVTAGIEHQLIPRVSVGANYFRRWYGNLLAIANAAITDPASAFDSYCIPTPSDARLPGSGNQQLCGFYDLKAPTVQNNVETNSARFGKNMEHWNGVDLSVNARLSDLNIQGGMSTGKTMTDNCDITKKNLGKVTVPPSLIGTDLNTLGAISTISSTMCHLETPFLTQIKFIGSYNLPWQGVQISGTVQSSPGSQIIANYSVPTAVVTAALGRAPIGSTSLQLVAPGSLYTPRVNQVDLRVGKSIKLGSSTLKPMLGIYNAFNNNSVLAVNNAYTPSGWQRAASILNARLLKFEVQLNF
jgi:hypothetical protein